MSNRHWDYGKGSSRSGRDDSRREFEKKRTRSRSRSPRRRSPREYGSRDSSSGSRERDRRDCDRYSNKKSPEKQDILEEVPPPPPPPRITKISIGFSKPKAPIKMNLGTTVKGPSKPTIASVFNADDDDDEEPEEMPPEARMRMRNIGRETPTSAGPNSFGKTKQGFCDAKKVFEKNLKEALETVDKPVGKFPQTIYKIKGP